MSGADADKILADTLVSGKYAYYRVLSIWFDLITTLLDFAGIFGNALGVLWECFPRDLWLWNFDFNPF